MADRRGVKKRRGRERERERDRERERFKSRRESWSASKAATDFERHLK